MFKINELIVYGNSGVCKVKDICAQDGDRLYYKLEPVFEKCVIFVPADTKIFMRPVISKDEALRLIDRLPLLEISLPAAHNNRELTEYYKTKFSLHSCDQTAIGKKPCQTDLKYIKKAEELLYGELSVVLDIPDDNVPEFLERTLSSREPQKVC